jgi:hypothetical protein
MKPSATSGNATLTMKNVYQVPRLPVLEDGSDIPDSTSVGRRTISSWELCLRHC